MRGPDHSPGPLWGQGRVMFFTRLPLWGRGWGYLQEGGRGYSSPTQPHPAPLPPLLVPSSAGVVAGCWLPRHLASLPVHRARPSPVAHQPPPHPCLARSLEIWRGEVGSWQWPIEEVAEWAGLTCWFGSASCFIAWSVLGQNLKIELMGCSS